MGARSASGKADRGDAYRREKPLGRGAVPVPQTDTGGLA